MHGEAPSLDVLEQLVASADIRDRAFAAGVLALRRHAEDPARIAALHERLRETALSHHAAVRERIRDGTLDRQALVARLREAPAEMRDHVVEEILDIAYPRPGEDDASHHCPSGVAEILFMLENAGLEPGKTFVDLGSGLGKVVLLVALLTGAHAHGVEIDPRLVSRSRAAARALHLDNARFVEGDIRSAPLPSADVYYMYIPSSRPTAVVTRLMAASAGRSVLVFSQALDLARLPWLSGGHAASYWLHMYGGPEKRPLAECEQRIVAARAAVFAASDGVVTARMTDLEREWRLLADW